MVLIRVGDRPATAPTRRVLLDPLQMVVLERTSDVPLPDDLRGRTNPLAADLAGRAYDDLVADATDRLHEAGVLVDGEPDPAVAFSLLQLSRSPRRVRTTYAGGSRRAIGYHWVGGSGGGSVVEVPDGFEVSAFDRSGFGREWLRLAPDDAERRPARRGLRFRLDDLATTGAVADELDGQPEDVVASVLGLGAGTWRRLRAFVGEVRGVLHASVADPAGGLPAGLVWFDTEHGWWSAVPETPVEGEREVVLTWRRREELVTDLGDVTTRWWVS